MRRHVGGAGCGACAFASQAEVREARVTVLPNYVGAPFGGLVGTGGRAAKAPRSRGGRSTLPVLKATVPEPKIAAVERQAASVHRQGRRAARRERETKRCLALRPLGLSGREHARKVPRRLKSAADDACPQSR